MLRQQSRKLFVLELNFAGSSPEDVREMRPENFADICGHFPEKKNNKSIYCQFPNLGNEC